MTENQEPQNNEPVRETSESSQEAQNNNSNNSIIKNVNFSDDDKNYAVLVHLLGILFSFIPAVIMFIVLKNSSEFLKDNIKEALNFQLSCAIYHTVCAALSAFCIGALLWPILIVFIFIVCIVATLEARRGEIYRYPLSIRFLI